MSLFCADSAQSVDEPLAGSAAAGVTMWIALEECDPWDPRAPKKNTLPSAVNATLQAWKKSYPGSRLQFIRRPQQKTTARRLFISLSSPKNTRLIAFSLSTVEALTAIDLDALVAGTSLEGGEVIEGPLFLVCAHGKRDRCCAKWGTAVFSACANLALEQTWQTTHLGGHRFAATLVVLPRGYCYGRVGHGDIPAMITSHREGRLFDLSKLRGRCCYDAPTQAAEVALRQSLSAHPLDDVEHLETQHIDGDHARVCFRVDAAEHHVDVQRQRRGALRITSCHDAPQTVTCWTARQVVLKTQAPRDAE